MSGPAAGLLRIRSLKIETETPDMNTMTNQENKKTGRNALNGDGRKKHLRKGGKRAANKASRRAAKGAL